PIPGLRCETQSAGWVDLVINFQALPPDIVDNPAVSWRPHRRFRSRRPEDQGDTPVLKITESSVGNYTRLSYLDELHFVFNSSATGLWIVYPEDFSLEAVSAFLLNPVFGFCLRMREITCMHATAIAVDEEHALLVAGASGAGKSTIAALFALHNHGIVSDDVSALCIQNGRICVQPGYPRIRLWPQSTGALLGDEDTLPPIVPTVNKQYLDLPAHRLQFVDKALPVGAVYALHARGEELAISQMKASEALISMMNNTYMDYILDPHLRSIDLKMLGLLVGQVPVYTVTPQDNLKSLDRLYEELLRPVQCES
ncbi:MAG: hypothetical protein H3C36_15765, partial [Chitinophagaceae bacterium]|nr:hypothetical protein [Chitinophagaceae bacterium]